MLKGPVCIVPQWKELRYQLQDKLELQRGLPEPSEGSHIRLSDRPSIVFRESCFPNCMPIICFYTSDAEHYFASFSWRRAKGSKVRAWVYREEEEPPVTEKVYAIDEDPMVLAITHAARLHLFVAYCDDIHFRFFADHTQDFRLLLDSRSPYSITSMCFNPATGELVTGAIGMVIFWSFSTEEGLSMGVAQEVPIASGEFVHALSLEQEQRVLLALCENVIRVYDAHSRALVRAFQVSQGVSLTCCSANWSQNFLYTGDLAGDVKVWNFGTGEQVSQFKAHLSAITSIISRMPVHTLMTASLDGLLKEWNVTTCELLRRVDIGEEVFQLQFITEQTFFLRTQFTFAIRTVNNFYQLFNRTKSMLKSLVRVQCGPDRARILATTEDGVVRFLSPVTGEMLFITWPFQLLEKALDTVYDPDREELLVTMGTTDIYALDTSKNPCPVKYILRAADSVEDKVLCLTYSRLDLEGRTSSFIFSGFKSGRVRTVTQQLYRMGSRKLHDGNVVALSSISAAGSPSPHVGESSYLCSYGLDEYIILSTVVLKKNSLLEVVPLVAIASTNCRIQRLLLIPGYICVLTEQNRVRLWRHAALVPGKKNPFWKETATLHPTSITSFDYCHTLGMLVTGGSDGSVRIWDVLGQLLVEFDTSLKFSRVCFANQRGDLVVGCNMNIYFISCVTYLPSKQLGALLAQHVRDDAVELPLPFLSRFLLSFDIVFVPKYRQVGKLAKKYERLEPITNHKEVVMEKDVARVAELSGKDASRLPGPDFYGEEPATKEVHPEFALEYELIHQHRPLEKRPAAVPPPYRGLPPLTEVPLLRRVPFQPGRSWPIAPDGYIPNSVVRAQLFPKGTPEALQCSLLQSRDPLPKRRVIKIQLPEGDTSEAAEKARKKKAQKMRPGTSSAEGPRRRDLLSELVAKPWLRHKPSDTTLPSVVRALLNLMDDVPYSSYVLCTSALVQLAEAYTLPGEVQEQAFDRLILDTTHKEVRMRLAAWEALGKMDLLTEQEVVPLARALLDENKKVRDLARSLLDSVAGITDKFVLKKEMQRLAETSLEDLTEPKRVLESKFPRRVRAAGIIAESQDEAVYALTEGAERLLSRVENQLTANLFLMSECPRSGTQPPLRQPLSRRRGIAEGTPDEFAKPDDHLAAHARWLGLFTHAGRAPPQASTTSLEATGPQEEEKRPRIQKAQGKAIVMAAPGGRGSLESVSSRSISSSSPSISSSSPSSSGSSVSLWREARQVRKEHKAREKRPAPKLLPVISQEAPKPVRHRRQAQPVLLQRRDTRTQLYVEVLKRQKFKKEEQVAALPVEVKRESGILQAKPSQPSPARLPSVTTKGSIIDPGQQYSADKSKWRSDLYRLLMLRIAPPAEGRTAAEDLLASARVALAGRAVSWEALLALRQALPTLREEITPEQAEWASRVEEWLKASFQEPEPQPEPQPQLEPQPQPLEESVEAVAAVRKRKEVPGRSASEAERSSEAERRYLSQEGSSEVESAASGKRVHVEKRGPKERERAGRRRHLLSKREKAGRAGGRAEEAAGRGEAGHEPEAPEGWEQAPSAPEQEQQAAGQDREAARGPDREGARGKGRLGSWGRERGETKPPAWERASKKLQVAQRKGAPPAAQAREVAEGLEEQRAPVRRLRQEVLITGPEGVLARVSEHSLAEMRAEAKELLLAELRERALVEVQEATLKEAMAVAVAEAREVVVAEAREKALLTAREKALTEAWEKALTEARKMARAEVMQKALAQAWEQLLAEGKAGEAGEESLQALAEARALELVEARAMELVEARAMELATAMSLHVDEERVLQLAEAEAVPVDEARVLELSQAKAMELVQAYAAELAQERLKGMSEEDLSELVEAKLKDLLLERGRKARRRRLLAAGELEGELEDELEDELEAELQAELEDELEAGLWEDLWEESPWFPTEEESEALIALWEDEPTPGPELELPERAQLLLEILTEPEKLESSDSKTFQRLSQVVSLLQVTSAMDAQALAKALVEKAELVLAEGALQELLPEGCVAVLAELKEMLQRQRSGAADTPPLAARVRSLLKNAQTVLRAKALKQKLARAALKQSWEEKAKAEGLEEGGRKVDRKLWLNTKIMETLRKWQSDVEKAQEQKLLLQQKKLQYKSRIISMDEAEKRLQRGREKAGREEPQQKREPPAPHRPGKLTWFMGQPRARVWKAIMQVDHDLPPAPEEQPQRPRLRGYRLAKDFLYKTSKPAGPLHRNRFRRGGRQHVFRLEDNKGIDWERFIKLFQSLMHLKEVEGGTESAVWHERASRLLDLYGVSNPLIRAMVQQLLMGGRHEHKFIAGNTLQLREAPVDLGQRILYELIHHSARPRPKPPAPHRVVPLSYQNNVHPFRMRGVTHFGTTTLKWKTFFSKGKLPRLRLLVHSKRA